MKQVAIKDLKPNHDYFIYSNQTSCKEMALLTFVKFSHDNNGFFYNVNTSEMYSCQGYRKGQNVSVEIQEYKYDNGNFGLRGVEFFELELDELIHFM